MSKGQEQVLGILEGIYSRIRYLGRKREFNAKEVIKEFEKKYQ